MYSIQNINHTRSVHTERLTMFLKMNIAENLLAQYILFIRIDTFIFDFKFLWIL